MLYSTYSIVGITRAMRRDDKAARAAYIAEMLRRNPGWQLTRPTFGLLCVTCGEPGTANDWCNMCEVMGNRPYPEMYPLIISPMCRPCIQDNIKCPVCCVRPSDGPSEDWPLIPADAGPDDVFMQLAGHHGAGSL